ncbi:ribosomal RNA-processing protein 7 A [Trichonephila inaurata madagascariensis]|uniref:Ribosomal RNA-processing protein 7 A n=1 Tax=Trichonephila inaurata madagascariensis TaxID=2747483 RepID=A0A8X6XWT9_9ARAC|nr:ribosomal RNA-processing protein 7 A [Trichonephila inaurata madagascariensis]
MSKLIEGFFPFSFNLGRKTVNRFLFLKKHEGEEKLRPSDRTLFIINVPQFFNESCLSNLFQEYGVIERTYIQMKPSSGEVPSDKSKFFGPHSLELGCKVAYVVFKHPDSLEKVFEVNDTKTVSKELFAINIGKHKFIDDYNNSFIDTRQLQEEIASFMKEYDTNVENEKQQEKEKEEPNEEGWVTISKFSKKSKIPRVEGVNKKILYKMKAAQSKQTKLAFYKNQLPIGNLNHFKFIVKRKDFWLHCIVRPVADWGFQRQLQWAVVCHDLVGFVFRTSGNPSASSAHFSALLPLVL